MFDNLKIGTKLALSILVVVFVILAVIGGISISAYRTSLIENSEDIMQARLDNVAEAINRENVQVASVVMSMADTQTGANFGNRQFVLDYTNEVLKAFPNFVGTYINYEPNADGQDDSWVGDEGCCTTGRFLPYWYWNDGIARDTILLAPTVELDGSPWYDGARNLFAEVGPGNPDKQAYVNITNPFVYEGVPMVSVTYPIERNGEFVGIAGVDRSLDQMYQIVENFKPYESAEIFILSKDGSFVTSSHDNDPFAGMMLGEEASLESIFKPFVDSNEPGVIGATNPQGENVFYSFSPVETGTWTVVMEVSRQEILSPVNRTLALVAIASLLGFLATAVAVWLISQKTVIAPIEQFIGTFGEFSEGDYSKRIAIDSSDEFGEMAVSLNSMLDETASLIQSDDERSKLQNSIITLLDEVSAVAEGDLTAEAEVRSDVTGAIADSFNFMIEQLRDIIDNVQSATIEVTTSANQIQATAQMLTTGSESQATQIIDTSAAIDEMSVSIQQVSENAARSATVGEQARENAQLGSQAVKATIGGMDRIRDEVAQTAERLGRLEASSREIGKVTKVINDIAARTSILAINASIQASEAGDAGRGFAVVAQEVELLANRSSAASQQINRLVKIIQSETGEVSSAMTSTSREVSRGAHLATEAGQRLDEIETVSTQLSGLIQSISHASQQQARGSEAIAQSMTDIETVTRQTAVGTKDANESIRKLAQLAVELRDSVSQFKIRSGDTN